VWYIARGWTIVPAGEEPQFVEHAFTDLAEAFALALSIGGWVDPVVG
jgi:hypothetical protein